MSITKLMSELDKALGANHEAQAVTQFINTGYEPLNYALSGRHDGGLPFGRMVEMFGESSSGKTALATQWMVEAQRMGGVAGFIDWEKSFDVNLAEGLGLNTKRPHWLYFRPRTWEEGNMLAAKAAKLIRESGEIPASAPILFVYDSIAAALPKSMADKEIDEYSMNDTTALARVTSTTLKSMASYCADSNATFLYLNQIRLKPGVVYGDPTTTPGGKAMEFYSTCRMSLGRQKIMEDRGGEKEFVGQKINIKVTKSKLTAPFKSASLRMAFDELGVARFDVTTSLIDYLIDKKALASSGARVTWTDGKSYYRKALAEKIDSEGLQAELRSLVAKAPAPAAEPEAA
jgi:protein RecA